MTERIITFTSGQHALHGILREPGRGALRGLIVICDPFAEEKKCAHRPLTDLARTLAQSGFAVLRFDYRGTGDSEGDFGDFTLQDWVQDIHRAAELGKAESGSHRVSLAGLRMGANLAEQVARQREDADRLVLWEPILDGKRYISDNLRRSLVKAMLTAGEDFSAQTVTQAHAQTVVDFDGYLVSAQTRLGLEALRLPSEEGKFAGPTLLVNIGTREQPGEAYVRAGEAFERAVVVGLRLEPFWNRIGLMDVGPLAEMTARMLTENG